MVLLYTVVLTLLGTAWAVAAWRAGRFERRYAKAALIADKALKAPDPKPGNGRQDLAATAKRYYHLGLLVQKRDALEENYNAWQGRADRLAAWVARVRNWRGQKLPYTAGVLDVWMLLILLDYCGTGEYVNAREAVRWVAKLVRGE
ncbi:MAG TPA: hypothetical protein VGF55_14810 [Gemmataceae bacterium]|jgi:hypothetical protein